MDCLWEEARHLKMIGDYHLSTATWSGIGSELTQQIMTQPYVMRYPCWVRELWQTAGSDPMRGLKAGMTSVTV